MNRKLYSFLATKSLSLYELSILAEEVPREVSTSHLMHDAGIMRALIGFARESTSGNKQRAIRGCAYGGLFFFAGRLLIFLGHEMSTRKLKIYRSGTEGHKLTRCCATDYKTRKLEWGRAGAVVGSPILPMLAVQFKGSILHVELNTFCSISLVVRWSVEKTGSEFFLAQGHWVLLVDLESFLDVTL